MSENIKPSEVSEVLLQQLKGIDTHLQFDEVGNVLQVSDGVARIYGLRNAEANELLEFENGIMAIVMNLEGGFIFEIGTYRLDASVANQIKRVKQQFIAKNRRIV